MSYPRIAKFDLNNGLFNSNDIVMNQEGDSLCNISVDATEMNSLRNVVGGAGYEDSVRSI